MPPATKPEVVRRKVVQHLILRPLAPPAPINEGARRTWAKIVLHISFKPCTCTVWASSYAVGGCEQVLFCVYLCECMCVCTCVSVCIRVCVSVVWTCVHDFFVLHVYIHAYVYSHVCVYDCVFVSLCVCNRIHSITRVFASAYLMTMTTYNTDVTEYATAASFSKKTEAIVAPETRDTPNSSTWGCPRLPSERDE